MQKDSPKLRTVNKSIPAFELNKFTSDFPYKVGEQLVYILATRGEVDIEGKEWEQIFANSIGATWKPSNVGLDDIVFGNTAWGAKSVLAIKPASTNKIRLISGRNDLINSYDFNVQPGYQPDIHGELVLGIYNERVAKIYEQYKHLRTVVLIRKKDLSECVVYEVPTIRHLPELYYWEWIGKNLHGYSKTDSSKEKKFTWQSGGQQFTIFEKVPDDKIIIKIRKPELVPYEWVLSNVGYDKSWITVQKINKNYPAHDELIKAAEFDKDDLNQELKFS